MNKEQRGMAPATVLSDLQQAEFKMGKASRALSSMEDFILGEVGRFIKQKCWLCPDPGETSGGKLGLDGMWETKGDPVAIQKRVEEGLKPEGVQGRQTPPCPHLPFSCSIIYCCHYSEGPDKTVPLEKTP